MRLWIEKVHVRPRLLERDRKREGEKREKAGQLNWKKKNQE